MATTATSALFRVKHVGNQGRILEAVSFIVLIEYASLVLLLGRWLTRSMLTVGPRSDAGCTESRPEAQMGWMWVAVRGYPRGV